MHVHFMGIGGSGVSGVAQITIAQGYKVSGCDVQTDPPYLAKLKTQSSKVKIYQNHDASHLNDVDILAVTPAVFFQSAQNSELQTAKQKNIIMTWQEFMGKYLHKDKFVICIAGTHGKSTTTAMVGQLLEKAGLDPTVEVGATVPTWHSNVRVGQSKYFISEADEYYHNFLHYHSDIAIINNIEMDHPEYFKTFDNVLQAFVDFVKNIKPGGILIYNSDSSGVQELLLKISKFELNIQLISFSLAKFPSDLILNVPGNHNKSNALGVIKLAQVLEIDHELTNLELTNFGGIGRRLEELGTKNKITVIDDYANHPTAFAANIMAVREKYPNRHIWCVIEPHTFSRLRAVMSEIPKSLEKADAVIITKIFAGREKDPGDFSGADIANYLSPLLPAGRQARYIPEFTDVVKTLISESQSGDIILVMGSGNSYKLSRQILENL